MKTDNKILDLNTDLKNMIEEIECRTEFIFSNYELLQISYLILIDRIIVFVIREHTTRFSNGFETISVIHVATYVLYHA